MSDKLKKNILATIAYYDGLNYPLTVFEVWKYLIRSDYYTPNNDEKITLAQISCQLQDKELTKYIEHYNGFYFLKGRSELVSKRIINGKLSAGKIKRLRFVAGLLRLVPFVRMIAITGALAMKNARVESDWDLFIVTKYKKIWTCRTLVTIFLHLLGKRRHGKHVADRVCLNFFVTNESLEIITKDLFSANEYMFLFPLYGQEIHTKFQIKNRWIKNMKPSYALNEIEPLGTLSDSFLVRLFRDIGEAILTPTWLEKWLGKIESKQIMLNPKTHQEGSLIYANDDALIFLPSPHGPKIFEKFKEKIDTLGVY